MERDCIVLSAEAERSFLHKYLSYSCLILWARITYKAHAALYFFVPPYASQVGISQIIIQSKQ